MTVLATHTRARIVSESKNCMCVIYIFLSALNKSTFGERDVARRGRFIGCVTSEGCSLAGGAEVAKGSKTGGRGEEVIYL